MVDWQKDPEFVIHAEHAIVGDYELMVFDLPADPAGPAVIGWELFGPPKGCEPGHRRRPENLQAWAVEAPGGNLADTQQAGRDRRRSPAPEAGVRLAP